MTCRLMCMKGWLRSKVGPVWCTEDQTPTKNVIFFTMRPKYLKTGCQLFSLLYICFPVTRSLFIKTLAPLDRTPDRTKGSRDPLIVYYTLDFNSTSLHLITSIFYM